MPLDYPVTRSSFAEPKGSVGLRTVSMWCGWTGFSEVDYIRRPLLFRVDSDGLPGPCVELRSAGLPYRLLWPVRAGTRTFNVWCKHSGHTPRPRVRVAANPQLGVISDVTADAQDTGDWHQLSVSVAPTDIGVLEVYLELLSPDPTAWVRWDNIEVS
jgi:CubicO group peptidase (beta-lactamase class C family)